MRLSYIPTFAAVCRWSTFSRAAEKLHISQPAVSKAIKELEQDCGVALFERQHSTISLTPEGRKLWEGCQRWLKESEELEKLGTSLKTGRQILRIGVVPMCGNTIFPQLHQQFLARHPHYQIRTVEDTASVLYGLLDRQELDLILCVTNHLPLAPYHCKVIKKSRLELFVARTHPLARKKFLSFQDLAGVPLVLFPDTFGQTRYIRRLFAQAQTDPQVLHQTSQVFTILSYIRSGAAAGFLPEEFARTEKELAAVPLEGVPAASINLVWLQDTRTHPGIGEFVRGCCTLCATPRPREPHSGSVSSLKSRAK